MGRPLAGIAKWLQQLFRKEEIGGSNPSAGSKRCSTKCGVRDQQIPQVSPLVSSRTALRLTIQLMVRCSVCKTDAFGLARIVT